MPIFHASPAQCHGGWTNDPNGPFEFKGVHHLFYQYSSKLNAKHDGSGGPVGWGHVAGNLSHWHCLPPAINPGVDYDGSETPYDKDGIFTGSTTVVNGVPVATYPGIPGATMCDASPVDLNDPLLVKWKKNPSNPLMRHEQPRWDSALGCTSAWREASGNWTTTIEIDVPMPLHCKMTFWTSENYINWTYVGNLSGLPSAFENGLQACSDFYPAPGGPANRFVFGDNRGGAITGTFDRAALRFTADRPQLADGDNRRLYSYEYGGFAYPKHYQASDGRHIIYGWLGYSTVSGPAATWKGMQSLPRVITAAPAADDPTTALLLNPPVELAALRRQRLVSERGMALTAAPVALRGVQGCHLDAVVTFRGLAKALAATPPPNQALTFTVLGNELRWNPVPAQSSAAWVNGDVTGGPLALRRAQDTVTLRVVVDGIVMESFWDGGRARYTRQITGAASQPTLLSSGLPGISVDVDIWQMGSAWLPAP